MNVNTKKTHQFFSKEFKSGRAGDDMNLIEWSSLYQMRERFFVKK